MCMVVLVLPGIEELNSSAGKIRRKTFRPGRKTNGGSSYYSFRALDRKAINPGRIE
jgi:hypothetical protein